MSKGAEYTFLQRKYTDGQKEKAFIIANHQENANQNRHENPPYHMSDGLLSKIKQITRVAEDVGKRDPCTLLKKMQIDFISKENSMKGPKKTKNRTTMI